MTYDVWYKSLMKQNMRTGIRQIEFLKECINLKAKNVFRYFYTIIIARHRELKIICSTSDLI